MLRRDFGAARLDLPLRLGSFVGCAVRRPLLLDVVEAFIHCILSRSSLALLRPSFRSILDAVG